MVKKNSDMYNTLLTVLQPHMKLLSDIGGQQSTAANLDFTKAGAGYDEALNFYKTIMSGDREGLLKLLDTTQVTKAYDEQARQNYELAPRGGRRAATAANLDFSKMSELNKLLQYLRGQAPGQIANISQALSAQGSNRLGQAVNSINSVTGLRTGIEQTNAQIQQQEADRKTALITSIIGAAGSVLGTFACNTLDTWIYTPKGHKQLAELRVGDKVYTLSAGEKLEEAKIIRKELKENQEVWELICNDTCLKGTLSHVISGMNNNEYSFQDLAEVLTTLPIYKNDELFITTMKSFKKKEQKEDVVILKLNNEKQNYNYITNGLISIDADCKE